MHKSFVEVFMDKEKIGKFLTELRKSKNMTQSDVSKLLYTSRENISKWERGINMPTPDTLLELSKIYDVSVNEILIGERKSDVNQEQIDNFSAVILKETNVKIKKIKKCLIVVLSILIFIIVLFLFYYFLNTYNSIHVFLVSGVNENVSTVDGIAIFSKGKSYIKLGKVKLNNDKTIDNIDFFIMINWEINIQLLALTKQIIL